MTVLDHLICPFDHQPLQLAGSTLRCPSGHSFDCGKSGYVNLLPVQRKRSKDPGDSKPMVTARRAFLDRGYYRPIADALVATLQHGRPQPAPLRVLDAGCGEGYYLSHLHARLQHAGYRVAAQGLDISKWAVQAASKRSRDIGWIVGSNAALPVPDGGFDLLLCLFGFPVFAEFARVLKPDGVLLMLDAGPDHLVELRRILYPELRPYRDAYADGLPGFEPRLERDLGFSFTLDSRAAIQDLLAMTPHLHKAPRAGREAAQALESIRLTADIKLRAYQPITAAR